MTRIFAAMFLVLFTGASALADELSIEGEAVQGGMMIGRAVAGTRIDFADRQVRVSPDGVFVIGFHRDDPPEMMLTAVFPDGHEATRAFKVRQREYDTQRIDGIPHDKVTPPPVVLARIENDKRLVKEAREIDSATTSFAKGFSWPVEGHITGVYGVNRFFNGEPRQPHFGIDIAAPAGTPVLAAAAGTVSLAEPDMYFSGVTVLIDHGHGVSSSYLHMQSTNVTVGQEVAQGQKIGAVGQTGRSTGPHLDWRINWFEKRLDPALAAPPFAGE